jgi:hypothetical protein
LDYNHPDHTTPQLLELPSAFLALLIQHTASGPGGLASAAALSQTCKHLHSLSEGPAVTYSNIHVPGTISNPAHQIWQWLAKRSGRIAGLSLQLCVAVDGNDDLEYDLVEWAQPLQTLSGLPSVQLDLDWERCSGCRDEFNGLAQWLRQHGQNINHLTLQVSVCDRFLPLREVVEAAAPCKSIKLYVQYGDVPMDLAELAPLAGSLEWMQCVDEGYGSDYLIGLNSLSSLQQLTYLCLDSQDFTHEQPWDHLAKLTSLKQLSAEVYATGDPSPLSALTGLSSLHRSRRNPDDSDADPFSFSSLQPLSMLRQLQTLQLGSGACTATSLQGLAGLRKLRKLEISGNLRSLEGISSGVTQLLLKDASDGSLAGIERGISLREVALHQCGVSSLQPLTGLRRLLILDVLECPLVSLESLCGVQLRELSLRRCTSLALLSGIEKLTGLLWLYLDDCDVTNLQPLSQLGSRIEEIHVRWCKKVHEVVLELPHLQPTAKVSMYESSVRKVVLAGGVVRAVR